MKKLPRSPYLNARFAAAIDRFGADFRASAGINHTGIKGGEREQSVIRFLEERLPDRFCVATGEVVDLNGNTGPQLDVLIFDRYADFAFTSGCSSILASEALLASVEIKSKLNSGEIEKCVGAARKLRQLRPHDRELGGPDIGVQQDGTKKARYMHCVFAFDTDLSESNWLEREVQRFDANMKGEHLIDATYVLGRGLINFSHRRARLEDNAAGAISSFYFSLLNFAMREADRRKPTPYDRYVTHSSKSWSKI